MTVLHSGSNNKYSENWAQAFQKGKKKSPATAKSSSAKGAKPAKSAKKATAARSSKKK